MYIQTINKKKALWFESNDKINEHKVVLFLTWFPKYPWRSKFIDLFLKQWYNVLCPMYSWTFESDWLFSIEESVCDAKLWYDFLLTWKVNLNIFDKEIKEYDIQEIVLCGVSYGWYVLSLLLDSYVLWKTKKAFFISMLEYGFLNKDNLIYIEGANQNRILLEQAFPLSYRFENVDVFFDQIKWNIDVSFERDELMNKRIEKILIHGKDDVMTPINIPEFYCKMHINTIFNPFEWGHSGKMDMLKIEDLIHRSL